MKLTLLLLIRTTALFCAIASVLVTFGCESSATIAPITPRPTAAPSATSPAPFASPAATVEPRNETPTAVPTAVCTAPALSEPLAMTSMPGSVTSPYGIAWQAGRLYVPGRSSNNIGLIEGDKLSQIIPLEGIPTQIVADELTGRLYVVTNNQHSVAMVEGSQVRATMTVTNPRIANYQRVTSLVLDTPRHRLLAAVEADMAGIAIIDTSTFSIARWIEIPGRHFSTRIVLDPAAAKLFVASSDKIETLDIDTGRVTQTTALPTSSYNVFTLDPATGRLFVDQSDGRSLAVIENGNVAARLPVGAEPHEGLVVGRRLYVASSFSNTLSVIDLDTLGTLATVPVGLNPRALAADPSGESVYVASGNTFARVVVVDTRTNAVTRRIPLAAQPSQMIGDETRKRLYALMPSSNEVLVTDGQRVLSAIPLDAEPGQMALDESAGRLYAIDQLTNRLSTFDVASGRLIDRRALPLTSTLTSLAVDGPNRLLFVNNDAFALDDLAPQGTYTITLYGYANEPNLIPYRLIPEPASHRLYAIGPNGVPGSNGGNVAYEIDSSKLRLVSAFGRINVFALVVDTPSQHVYVASTNPIEGISRVFVYNTPDLTYDVELPMPSLVTALALNTRTHHLFAAWAGSTGRRPADAAVRILDSRTMGTVTTLPLGADPTQMAILGDRIFIAHRSGSTLSVVRDCAGSPPPAPTATPTPEPYVTPTPLPSPTPTVTRRPVASPTSAATPVADCRVPAAPWASVPAGPNADLRAIYGCPSDPPQTVQLARQDFEHGVMLWRADTRQIYVIYAKGVWTSYADTWDATQPEGGGEAPPRPDLRAPKRGFGKVWREQLGNGAEIGWATGEEHAVTGAFQRFERGLVLFGQPDSTWWLAADSTWH